MDKDSYAKTNGSVEEKFSLAYSLYADKIKRHVLYRVNSGDIAEDILQDAFLKTWQYLIIDKKEIVDLKSFIFTVVNNMIIDFYRQKNKKTISFEEMDNRAAVSMPEWDIIISQRAGNAILRKYLTNLDSKYKKILSYHFLENLSIAEISKLTGKSPNNISVIKHRGLKMLKKIIDFQAVTT